MKELSSPPLSRMNLKKKKERKKKIRKNSALTHPSYYSTFRLTFQILNSRVVFLGVTACPRFGAAGVQEAV